MRQIVTGNDEYRLSYVLIDATAANIRGTLTELWHTDSMPASNAGTRDNAANWSGLEPPRRGALFRFFEVAPEVVEEGVPPAERERLWAERIAAIKAAHCRPDTRRHPAMHKTSTTDYIILLAGRITLILDRGEVELRPFDVLVQRGANHAWVNRGGKNALPMAVLVDAGVGAQACLNDIVDRCCVSGVLTAPFSV